MKKAYFFINGFLLKNEIIKDNDDVIKLDNQYTYQIENFGVSKEFDSCVFGAIYDLIENDDREPKIIPNSYAAVFEFEISDLDYNTIDESCNIADFDILKFIKNNQEKLVYSVMFDSEGKQIENFINSVDIKTGGE